jgi:hypothetical protein
MAEPTSNNDPPADESQNPEQAGESLPKPSPIGQERFDPISPHFLERYKQILMGDGPAAGAMIDEMRQRRQEEQPQVYAKMPSPEQHQADQLRAIIQDELIQAEQRILTQVSAMLDQLWEELTRDRRGK